MRTDTWWKRWVHRPEQLPLRQFLFQLHFWAGAAAGMWVFLLSVTGIALIFRDQLSAFVSVDSLLALHANLLAG